MTAVILGIVFILLGLVGMSRWFDELLSTLRGLGPLSLFLGGVVTLVVGLTSFRPTKKSEDSK